MKFGDHKGNHPSILQCKIYNCLWFIASVQILLVIFDGITQQPVGGEEVRRLSQVLARCYRVARDDSGLAIGVNHRAGAVGARARALATGRLRFSR